MSENRNTMRLIGNQRGLEAIKMTVKLVAANEYTIDELKSRMDDMNEMRETKLFQDVDEVVAFVSADESRSLRIVDSDDSGILTLTDDGNELLMGNFEKRAFELFERKSREEFEHFHLTLKGIDKEVIAPEEYQLGTTLDDVNAKVQSWASTNERTAQVIVGLLRDFGIVSKQDGVYKVHPDRYMQLRNDKTDVLLYVIREYDGMIAQSELKRHAVGEFGWTVSQFDDILQKVKDDNSVYDYRAGGTDWIKLSN